MTDILAVIFCHYLKRFPMELKHSEELLEEHLAAVDNNAPDSKVKEPDQTKMAEREYKQAMEAMKKQRWMLEFCKKVSLLLFVA